MTNPLARHGHVSYLEIAVGDAEKSARFFEAVFGWAPEVRTDGDVRFSGPDVIGRFVPGRPPASRETGWLPFIYVEDVDAAVRVALEHGGALERAAWSEGDLRIARVLDPAGNLLGVWQFAAPASR